MTPKERRELKAACTLARKNLRGVPARVTVGNELWAWKRAIGEDREPGHVQL